MLTACVLGVLAVAGCGVMASGRPASATGCAAIAVRAARGQTRLTGLPAPCRGLGPVSLSQTVKIAVYDVARHGSKSRRRHLAIQAYRRLTVLTTAADRKAAAAQAARARRRPARPVPRPTAAAPGLRVPAGFAALVAWLLTAGAGGILALRPRRRPPLWPRLRSLPPVLVAHLSFALAGLVVWVAYLMTGWTALAWAALGALLPVTGLGMGTLILAIPDPKAGDESGGGIGGAMALGHAARGTVAAVCSAATATRPAPVRTAATRRRPGRTPVLLIAVHGALAALTILLALLGAVAAVAAH